MSTITAFPAVDVPAPILALLRERAAEEIENVADVLCSGQEGLDELEAGAEAAQERLARMEDAIVVYRRIFAAGPYDLNAVIALATSYLEHESQCDHEWPATLEDARYVLDHIDLIRQRDEWVRLAEQTA